MTSNCEMLFWEAFQQKIQCCDISSLHFMEALSVIKFKGKIIPLTLTKFVKIINPTVSDFPFSEIIHKADF